MLRGLNELNFLKFCKFPGPKWTCMGSSRFLIGPHKAHAQIKTATWSQKEESHTCLFPRRHSMPLLCLETLDNTSCLCLGAILNDEITKNKTKWNPKIQKCKNHETKWTAKSAFVYSVRAKRRWQSVTVQPCLGMCTSDNPSFPPHFTCPQMVANELGSFILRLWISFVSRQIKKFENHE